MIKLMLLAPPFARPGVSLVIGCDQPFKVMQIDDHGVMCSGCGPGLVTFDPSPTHPLWARRDTDSAVTMKTLHEPEATTPQEDLFERIVAMASSLHDTHLPVRIVIERTSLNPEDGWTALITADNVPTTGATKDTATKAINELRRKLAYLLLEKETQLEAQLSGLRGALKETI